MRWMILPLLFVLSGCPDEKPEECFQEGVACERTGLPGISDWEVRYGRTTPGIGSNITRAIGEEVGERLTKGGD